MVNTEQVVSDYQRDYDRASAELDAAETGKTVPPAGEDGTQPPDSTPPAPSPPQDDETPETDIDPNLTRINDLEKKLNASTKALHDTQSWSRGIVQRLREMQKQLTAKDAPKRPELLDDMDGLTDAIKFVLSEHGEPNTKVDDEIPDLPGDGTDVIPSGTGDPEADKRAWIAGVGRALPDADEWLKDEGFRNSVQKERMAVGEKWNDPMEAVRIMTSIRMKQLETKAKSAPTPASGRMVQPTGGVGTRAPAGKPTPQDEVNKVWSQSDAEFDKTVQKVKGF